MVKYLPIMFASGRVAHNRLLVTLLDIIAICAIWFSCTGNAPVWFGFLITVLFIYYYINEGYYRYFLPVKTFDVSSASISYESGVIAVSLSVSSDRSTYKIELPVKVACGAAYNKYVLYIYMSLCSQLVQYARELKGEIK